MNNNSDIESGNHGNYFEYLVKQCDNPKKAYRRYMLEKHYIRYFVLGKNVSPDVKKVFEIQTKLNNFCEDFINNNLNTDNTALELRKQVFGHTELKKIFWLFESYNILPLLMSENREIQKLLRGDYFRKIEQNERYYASWSDLKNLVTKEHPQTTIIDEEIVKKKLTELVDYTHCESILIAKSGATELIINQIIENCEQLAHVMDFNIAQVVAGCHFNIDNSESEFSGSASRYNQDRIINLNSSKMSRAFAHEWLHTMDILWSSKNNLKHYFASNNDIEIIDKLLLSGEKSHVNAMNEIVSKMPELMMKNIFNYIQSDDKKGYIKYASQLKEEIMMYYEELLDGKPWNKNELSEIIAQYQTNIENKVFKERIVCEFELLDYLKNKEWSYSAFYQYARIFNENIDNINGQKLSENYATLKSERFARMFESYVALVLEEKKMINTIATNQDFFSPQKEEVMQYRLHFKEIISTFQTILNNAYPLQIENNTNTWDKNHVLKNLNDLRPSLGNNLLTIVNKKVK